MEAQRSQLTLLLASPGSRARCSNERRRAEVYKRLGRKIRSALKLGCRIKMVFGILEDKYLEHVPGTALLSELSIVHGHEVTLDEASDLKRGTGRNAHIVLNPQPSDDPRDPLNWPRWKKEACFWTLAFAASLDGALSPMTGPGYVLLSKQFDTSVDNVASSFGAILLGLSTFMLVQGSFIGKITWY